jgi:hypothetical protein
MEILEELNTHYDNGGLVLILILLTDKVTVDKMPVDKMPVD